MTTLAVYALLSALAAGMSTIVAVAVRWGAYARGPLARGTVQFVLAMMAGMFVGVLVYFAVGGAGGLVAGLWVSSAIMSGSVAILLLAFAREARAQRTVPGASPVRAAGRTFVISVIGLVLANEFLMAWSFGLLSGGLSPDFVPKTDDLAGIATGAITSAWFVFPMALEMLLTLRWLLGALPARMRPFLLLQPAAMVCSPPTLPGLGWEVSTAVAASGLMSAAVALYLLSVFRGDPLSPPVAGYAVRLIISFGVMSVGLYLWATSGNAVVFALSLLVQMVVFLEASVRPHAYAHTGATLAGRPSPALSAGRTGGS